MPHSIDPQAERAHRIDQPFGNIGFSGSWKAAEYDEHYLYRAPSVINQAQWMASLQPMASKSAHPASPFVFQPSKGGLWINEPSVTIRHFKSALEALNIRERRQYDTRHTYATMCLMSGMNPAFIANRPGHSVEMLLSTYAKWISSSSDWRELEKLPPRGDWPKIGPKLTRRPKYTSGTPAGQALDLHS